MFLICCFLYAEQLCSVPILHIYYILSFKQLKNFWHNILQLASATFIISASILAFLKNDLSFVTSDLYFSSSDLIFSIRELLDLQDAKPKKQTIFSFLISNPFNREKRSKFFYLKMQDNSLYKNECLNVKVQVLQLKIPSYYKYKNNLLSDWSSSPLNLIAFHSPPPSVRCGCCHILFYFFAISPIFLLFLYKSDCSVLCFKNFCTAKIIGVLR